MPDSNAGNTTEAARAAELRSIPLDEKFETQGLSPTLDNQALEELKEARNDVKILKNEVHSMTLALGQSARRAQGLQAANKGATRLRRKLSASLAENTLLLEDSAVLYGLVHALHTGAAELKINGKLIAGTEVQDHISDLVQTLRVPQDETPKAFLRRLKLKSLQ